MKKTIGLVLILAHSVTFAQSNQAAQSAGSNQSNVPYTYAELRYIDFDDNGGDGFEINGSYDLGNDWLIVGGLTSAGFNNNVDVDSFEVGAGYVWRNSSSFDLVSTARFVRAEVDTPGGSSNDNGIALSSGVRGFLAPQFEIRGAINFINVDDSDLYLELGGDYFFTRQFAAGLTLEFAGDADLITVGVRWFFR